MLIFVTITYIMETIKYSTHILNAKFRQWEADVEGPSDEHVGSGDQHVGQRHVSTLA